MEVPRESSRVAASATRDLLWYITQSLRFFAMIFPPSAGCRRPNWVHFLFRSLAVQLPGGSLLHLSSCWGKKSPVVLTAPFFKKKKKKKKNSLPRWRWEMWQIKVRRQSCRINKNRRVVKKKSLWFKYGWIMEQEHYTWTPSGLLRVSPTVGPGGFQQSPAGLWT